MTNLRIFAKVFKPGNVEHIVRKTVNWHTQGVTKLKTVPKSSIRDYNPVDAAPYTIPQPPNHFDEEWIYLRSIAEKDSHNVLAYPVDIEHLIPCDPKQYSNKETYPKKDTVKGEWRMWCE